MHEDEAGPEKVHDLVRHLQAERDQLLARLEIYEALQFLPGRPILHVSHEMLDGYLLLESDERQFTALALSEHRDFVALWYRYFNLLKRGIRGNGKPREAPELSVPDQLAMRFIAVASGTAKLILDAGLAGYYTQAFGLVRHLFETWFRLEYVRMRPDEAVRWFVSEDGTDRFPPNESVIHSYVERHAENLRKPTVTMVKERISKLNKMAHPSEEIFQQSVGVSFNVFKIGANYIPELCVGVLHEGGSGLRFILHALNDVLPQSEEWEDVLRETEVKHGRILEREKQRLAENDIATENTRE